MAFARQLALLFAGILIDLNLSTGLRFGIRRLEIKSVMKIQSFAALLLAALILVGSFSQGNLLAESGEENPATTVAAPARIAPVSEYLERLELRSVVRLPGGPMFSLRDPAEGTTFWIEPGQNRDGLQVVGFDAEKNLLTLRHGDARRTLSLSSARIQATAEPAPASGGDGGEPSPNPRAEVYAFLERWNAAVEDSSELKELEDHFREVVGQIQRVNNALRDTEEGSDARERLTNVRNELNREFAAVQRLTVQTLNNTPDFGEFDPRMIPQVIRVTNGFQQQADR